MAGAGAMVMVGALGSQPRVGTSSPQRELPSQTHVRRRSRLRAISTSCAGARMESLVSAASTSSSCTKGGIAC